MRTTDKNFSNFKSSEINYRIALCDPKRNGLRYLKTLIYSLASRLSEKSLKKLLNIKNRDIGRPIAVKYRSLDICLDYLQAVMELEFLEENMEIENIKILEVGAGYGRTCHALLSNFQIKSYTIVELCNYQLIQKYLKEVLESSTFEKVCFFKYPNIPLENFDLVINIDSFGEMPVSAVKKYLAFIDEYCFGFYTKNTVGKYLEKELDDHWRGEALVKKALKSGLLQEIINPFDESEIRRKSRDFLRIYQPGSRWNCIAHSWPQSWPHYWQSLYKKEV